MLLGCSIPVVDIGTGPAIVMLHGFGDTGDMWALAAAELAKTHTVVVPDLRGMGLSAHPDTGYTKTNQANDIAGVMDNLHIERADLVTHDIGEAISMAERVIVLSRRPGRLKSDNRIQFASASGRLTPFAARNTPEFNVYFNRLWQELEVHVEG